MMQNAKDTNIATLVVPSAFHVYHHQATRSCHLHLEGNPFHRDAQNEKQGISCCKNASSMTHPPLT